MNVHLERMIKELRNPRKGGLVAVLMLVALVLWGRMLWQQAPESVSAEPAASAGANGAAGPELGAGPVAPIAPDGPVVRVNRADQLDRDLFALKREAYPPTKDARTGQEAEKSPAKRVDDRQRLAEVRQAAAGLTLQSVVTGDRPRAVIDGRMLEPGQRIAGFTVVRVAERFVLIQREGWTLRLDL